jgi:hypothetical protein
MTDIKDGIYGTVSGTVGRSGTAKNGPYAVVEVQRDGSLYPDRVTCWGLEALEGDRMSVKGWLSWRKNERDGKTFFDVSLNKPVVEKHEKGGAVSPAVNDQTPF